MWQVSCKERLVVLQLQRGLVIFQGKSDYFLWIFHVCYCPKCSNIVKFLLICHKMESAISKITKTEGRNPDGCSPRGSIEV